MTYHVGVCNIGRSENLKTYLITYQKKSAENIFDYIFENLKTYLKTYPYVFNICVQGYFSRF